MTIIAHILDCHCLSLHLAIPQYSPNVKSPHLQSLHPFCQYFNTVITIFNTGKIFLPPLKCMPLKFASNIFKFCSCYQL